MVIDEQLHNHCKIAPEINEKNLIQIIQDNKNTAFGEKYGFEQIKSIEDYQNRVPLSNYEEFSPYIKKMMQGSKNQLTVYPLAGFCHTSGTTGEQKYIPVTETELSRFSNYYERYQDEVQKDYGGKRLHLNTFRTKPGKKLKQPLLFTEIYYKYMREQKYLNIDTFVGGDDLLFVEQPGEIYFAKLWAALLEENITMIESVFLYDQLCFFGYLEENWEKVTQCIRKGSIPESLGLSEQVTHYLLSLPVQSERLEQVEKECGRGFENIAGRLWPNLRLLSGISNKAFFSEDTALKRYARDIPRYYLCYCASECYMGHPMEEDDFRYVLMPNHAFFEFLPYKKSGETCRTVLPHEVKPGKEYEIVYTTFAGLYRYRMGDIVKIVGFYEQSPVMEFSFRKNQFLNLAGEKMSVTQIEEAVNSLGTWGIKVEQYCFGSSMKQVPGRYVAGLVLDECCSKTDPHELSVCLDKILQQKNADYKDLRNLNLLDCLDITIFDKETYPLFLQKNGLSNGHNKPKHIATGRFLERNLNV